MATACPPVRLIDKEANENQIALFNDWWKEQLHLYGTNVNYYSKGYEVSGHDFLYGEDLEQPFDCPREIIVGLNITNDASTLSKFGIILDSDAVAYIHIEDFHDIFGPDAEPKSQDVLELIEVGTDRPGGRGAPKYEITDRDDDDFPAGINPLMGHYIWLLKLKRFEYSHEPGITPEPATGVVDDTSGLSTATSALSVYQGKEDEVYGGY